MRSLVRPWPLLGIFVVLALIGGGIGATVSAHGPDDPNTIHS